MNHRRFLTVDDPTVDWDTPLTSVDPTADWDAPSDMQFLDLTAAAANGIPTVPWLVEGWLARGDIVLCAGRAGSGKSTLAVALAVAIASGREWCGIKPSDTGPVIYLDEEAGESAITRQFLRHAGDDLSNLLVSSCIGLRLDNSTSMGRLHEAIKKHKPLLVVLDTATQFFAGADENSATAIGERFHPLLLLRDLYGCSFIIVHHLRKVSQNGGHFDPLDHVRGSTAFTTQASAVWSVTRITGGHAVDVVVHKRRGGSGGNRLRVEYVESGDRIELRSLDAPEVVETQLASASHFIVAHLGTLPERRATTSEIVSQGKASGYKERTIKAALAHLLGVKAVLKKTRGIYELPPRVQIAAIDDEDV